MSIIAYMQLWILLRQLAQLLQHDKGITSRWKLHTIIHKRGKLNLLPTPFKAKTIPCMKTGQSLYCTYTAAACLLAKLITGSGVQTNLIDLFILRKLRFYLETAAGDFHMRQTVSILIPTDFKYPGTKCFRICRSLCTGV